MNQLQELMRDLYLQKDQQRGLEKTLLWLVSEIGEDPFLPVDPVLSNWFRRAGIFFL